MLSLFLVPYLVVPFNVRSENSRAVGCKRNVVYRYSQQAFLTTTTTIVLPSLYRFLLLAQLQILALH